MDLFIGTNPDTGEQYLITVYHPDKPGGYVVRTIATRDHVGASWSPPIHLTDAP